MKTSLSDNEVRLVELDILDYIDKICKKYNISYFLDYGTLLGAIRHKGFIPWDDDIDIAMKREDYERFSEVMKSESHSRFKFLTSKVDSYYPYEMGKVVDTRTKLIETNIQTSPDMGVWVDVFPKDYIPKHHLLLRISIFITFTFRVFAVYKKFPNQHSILFLPIWFISRLLGYHFFLRITQCLIELSGKCKNPLYIGSIRDFVSKEYKWDKSFFDQIEYKDFEGKSLPVPQKWSEYLTGLYGDYMTLPPEDKRKRHKFNVYWK